ncbi:MAG: aminotransferase class I/II-fold pyridoxal phosphate-dependent enzyme, partial [Pseudomonadota bacterium]
PEQGEPFENVLRDLEKIILPGLTHWQSPNFFAYFPSNNSSASVLGDLISSGLGVQGMLWATSPACTELETHILDWLVDAMGLPTKFKSSDTGGGVLQDTASSSSLCALLAARERATNFQINEQGFSQQLTVYTSTQTHSSVEKAAKIAGIGRQNLRLIDTDETFAMKPEALADAIAKDKANGYLPAFVCATIGTTSSTAIDPLPAIGEICQRENLWLHVDAAHAGSAAVCSEFHWIHEGMEYADSYCFNPHKWLLTNFDCDCFYIADRAALINTLSILPEYLKNEATESGAVFDYRDWHIPLGRRFRALKLWCVIRAYGMEGLQQHIREHVRLAQLFKSWVEADPDFEMMAPTPFNLVCFRHIGGDEINETLMNQLNDTGELYFTHTKLGDKFTLRMAIGSTRTREPHVEKAWQLIQQTAQELSSA